MASIGTKSPMRSSRMDRSALGRIVAFSATVQLYFYGKPVLWPGGLLRIGKQKPTRRYRSPFVSGCGSS
jgi:hypothetical protein